MGDRGGHFGQALLGILQDDVDPSRFGAARDQVAAQQRLGKRDRGAPGQLFRRHLVAVAHQILNRQIVAVGPTVLEVGHGVDADGKGRLPSLGGDALDGGGMIGGEQFAVLRLYDEQDVGVLGIGRLEFLEGDQFRIVGAEENTVVVREFKVPDAGADGEDRDEGRGDHEPTTADDKIGQRNRPTV